MGRITINFPDQLSFQMTLPVRISDINYGGHVGNDRILSLFHEARLEFLHSLGYHEMNMEGPALIMSDAAIEFKAELFHRDLLRIQVAASDFSRIGFDLFYKMEKQEGQGFRLAALGKTGMVCFDYGKKKICALPEAAREKLSRARILG